MKLQQLLSLCEVVDGPAPGEEGWDVYAPKSDVILTLQNIDGEEGPSRYIIDQLSIQENDDDDCMMLVLDVNDCSESLCFNLNDNGELIKDLAVQIFRLSRK